MRKQSKNPLAVAEAEFIRCRDNLISTMSDPDGLSDPMPSIEDADDWLINVDLSNDEAVAELDFDLGAIWQYGMNYASDAESLQKAMRALIKARTKATKAAA